MVSPKVLSFVVVGVGSGRRFDRVWRRMLEDSLDLDADEKSNSVRKLLKFQVIGISEHIGVPICTDRLRKATEWQLWARYRCGPR